MSMVTDVTKKIILAGLGTIDEQNEEVKDLLKRGSAIMGVGAVDNEELLYNGNREEILRRRKEREKEDNTIDLGNGKTFYYNAVKDEDGKVVSRDLGLEKNPEYGSREVSFEAVKNEDGSRKFGIHTSEEPDNNLNKKGGATND